ncbi:transcriptional repressor TCF25-domain-containing protein [Phakopsora pachyrhizi]|nr:transcriptional repressor TCF25-domain-containing protein [Phakopsora pachyrhizi]
MGRASRRQQTAQEELRSQEQALNSTTASDDVSQTESVDEDEDGVEEKSPGIERNAFVTLSSLTKDTEVSETELSEDEEAVTTLEKSKSKRKKSKKKSKKKPIEVKSQMDLTSNSQSNLPTETSKKSNSKTPKQDVEIDEIEAALKDIAALGSASTVSNQANSKPEGIFESGDLFLVDGKMLDAELELRRMFGSRVVSSATIALSPDLAAFHGTRTLKNPHHQVNIKLKATLLAKPQAGWIPHNKTTSGLSMRALDRSEIESAGLSWSKEPWFCFEHSMSFRSVQSRFISATLSLDPNRFMPLLSALPYHPDTLLQLSDMFNGSGDPGQSIDFLNRALYSFERSFHPSFNLTKSECRLDFRLIENRGIFSTLEKRMQTLMKRGCWRAAFETCKFLLALNPYQDPYGALLWIDLLAYKAKQYQYLLNLVETMPKVQSRHPEGGIYIEAYPNLYYSKALCLRALNGESKESVDSSTVALEGAILRFPGVIVPLAHKIGLDVPSTFHEVPRAMLQPSYSETPDNVLHLQSRIYVYRSADLWKDHRIHSWLQSTIKKCHLKLLDPCDPDVILGEEICRSCGHAAEAESTYRSVFIADDRAQALKHFLPPRSKNVVSYIFDPWPPSDGTYYDKNYFSGLTNPYDDQRVGFQRRAVVNEPADEGERGVQQLGFEGLVNRILGGDRANEHGIENDLIEQIQVALLAEEGNMGPAERQALLERLDALIQADRQYLAQGGQNDDTDQRDVAQSSSSSGNRTQMPGSFTDENSED